MPWSPSLEAADHVERPYDVSWKGLAEVVQKVDPLSRLSHLHRHWLWKSLDGSTRWMAWSDGSIGQ